MIIPMLKYSFLIYHREYDAFLKKLQDLGVLHIHWRPTGEDNETCPELSEK
jgi:V/A-type H+-transporting ATPase subunit I